MTHPSSDVARARTKVRARLRPAAVLAAVAVMTAVLAACSHITPSRTTSATGSSAASVLVSGSAWGPPTFTYDAPIDATTSRTEELWGGIGPDVKKGDVVVLDTYAEDGRDHKVVSNTFAGTPRVARVEPKTLGADLYRLIIGRSTGSRLLDVQQSDSVPLITSVDVLPGRAVGAAVKQGAGEPVVRHGDDGAPSISLPKGAKAPAQLSILPLIRGTGPQIETGQDVTVQYTGVTWKDGSEFGTTWGSGKLPVTVRIGVGDVIEGWDQGLVEIPVGSEVMLIVPPDLAYKGTSSKLAGQTLVYVIDILDAHTPGTGPKVGSTVAPTPKPSATHHSRSSS